MFGFFKKKSGEVPEEQERLQKAAARESERREAPEVPEELRALGQKFLPEEFSILAVTGAGGFGGSRPQENGPWLAVLELTAWKEEDSDQPAHREKTQLVALADDKLMEYLRRRVRGELGLTISVGVSFNKVFAKLGSDYKKPDAVTLISPDNFRALVWPLPVTDLLYVGRAAADTLKRFGVRTIGDLARFDREALFSLLGRHGRQLHAYANGLDRSPVSSACQESAPKSIGNGLTFPRSLSGREEICSGIAMLSDRVAVRLRRAGMKAAGVSLAIRDPDFRDISRQRRLEPPTCLARELSQAAVSLAEGCWNMDSPVRALTVTALYLISEDQAGVQLDLLGQADAPRRDRLERLDRTLDQIRAKYGRNAISPASSAGVCQGGVQEEDEEGATS